MSDEEVQGEVQQVTEVEVIDIDGDGVADAVRETTTTVVDVDGDGVADIVEVTTTTAIDVDGDGTPDIVQSTTVTGVDVDGDGEFSEDEIVVERTTAMTEELAEALEEAEAEAGE